MKTGLAKRLLVFIVGITMLVGGGAAMAAASQTKPYLKGFGADLMTGGWFNNGNNCATGDGTNYQDPNFFNSSFPKDDRNGGILTFTRVTQRGGDSSQYAAFSAGTVDGNGTDLGDSTDSGYGFYSSAALTGLNAKALTYANTDPALNYGGKFEGSIPQGNCIPDYYSKKPNAATDINNISQAIGLGTGDYKATAAPQPFFTLTNGASGKTFTIPAGQRMAIYVDGDVYINSNIVYDNINSKVDKVPKFALVAKGSIFIDPAVHQLDGLYIAQPGDTTSAAVAADDGIIWTCHDNTIDRPGIYYVPVCNTPLVVNGAFIAKQVNMWRVNGNIAGSSTGEDNLGTVTSCSSGACNLSEAVNYAPGMVMGGSFFNSGSGGSGNTLPIDSLISLPPVF